MPGGTGNFTAFDQRTGGPYSGFNVIVRNGVAVFMGEDSAFGVNDLGTVVLSGLQDTPFGQSIFTAATDGTKLTIIADEDHRLQDPAFTPACVDWNNASIAIGGNSGTGDVVVFSGEASGWQGFYSGSVTNLFEEFSVDNGGVVFVAINGVDNKSGVFLSSGGQFTKVLVTGDAFEGFSFPDASNLNVSIWPEGYSNGVIAFGFDRAVVVASPTGTSESN